MKQKKMWIIRVGMLSLLLILLGNTSYAMSLGGFEVQMGTGEATFPAEGWTEEPIPPFVPEPGFQEEAGGQSDFPVEPSMPDGYGATSESVPHPETMPYPESLPCPELFPYPNPLPYPENEIEQPTKNYGQEAYINNPMAGEMPILVPSKAPNPVPDPNARSHNSHNTVSSSNAHPGREKGFSQKAVCAGTEEGTEKGSSGSTV